jgi:UPF0755 protein
MFKKLMRLLGVFALIVAILGICAIRQAWFFWVDGVPLDNAAEITVEVGTGFSGLSDQLAEEGAIRSAFWFKVYTYLEGSASDLKAGTYLVEPDMSYANLVDRFVDGTIGEDISLTIPEGYTSKQIGETVAERFNITLAQWNAADLSNEGYLFPDTYRFLPEVTAAEIVEKMRSTFNKKTADLEPYGEYSMNDWVIIASILEREVQSGDDMAMVADIIYKRLDIGMALQMDSTVNYFTGKDTPSISFADRDIDNPYNTYLYPGLPPGPISNPGLAALVGAAQPESNDYFYFLTDAEGNVHYAVTYDEHLANKSRYLD